MFLESLILHNFRCFSDLTVNFNNRLTVIVGGNGAGKSTVLDAATIAAGTLTSAMDGLTNYGIKKGDAHYKCFDLGSNVDVQPQFPVEITAIGDVDGKEITWTRNLNSAKGRGGLASAKPLILVAQSYQERMRSGDRELKFQLGKLAIQSTVSTLGTTAIAAQAMTNILENLNGIAAIGVGVGLMTIVGQCLGAGRKDEAVYYIKKLCVIAECVIIVSCLIVYVLARPVTILGGMEKTSAAMCIHMINWITIVKPLVWTMGFVPGYGLRAAGDVKFSMITSCCTMWACRFCLCVFLIRVLGFGPMGVWIGMFADWTVRGIIFTWRFHSRKWLEHKVI